MVRQFSTNHTGFLYKPSFLQYHEFLVVPQQRDEDRSNVVLKFTGKIQWLFHHHNNNRLLLQLNSNCQENHYKGHRKGPNTQKKYSQYLQKKSTNPVHLIQRTSMDSKPSYVVGPNYTSKKILQTGMLSCNLRAFIISICKNKSHLPRSRSRT